LRADMNIVGRCGSRWAKRASVALRSETAAYVNIVYTKSGQPRVKPGFSRSTSNPLINLIAAVWY